MDVNVRSDPRLSVRSSCRRLPCRIQYSNRSILYRTTLVQFSQYTVLYRVLYCPISFTGVTVLLTTIYIPQYILLGMSPRVFTKSDALGDYVAGRLWQQRSIAFFMRAHWTCTGHGRAPGPHRTWHDQSQQKVLQGQCRSKCGHMVVCTRSQRCAWKL